MMILAVRYSFLFWLSFSDSILIPTMEYDDHNIFRISACTSRCLQQHRHYHKQHQFHHKQHHHHQQQQQHHEQTHQQYELNEHKFPYNFKLQNQTLLKVCYDFCRMQNETSWHLQPIRKIHENLILKLVCRDDRSLTFRIEAVNSDSTSRNLSRKVEDLQNDYVYVIKIHVARGAQEYSIYLSDDNFFTIDTLKHNTTHNITAVIVHANNDYSIVAKSQPFRTLRLGYTPDMIKDIQVKNFHIDEMINDKRLIAEIAWKPSSDMTCYYNIICFSPESEEYDLTPLEIRDPRQLYSYHLVNLTFSSIYKVGIRAKNPNNMAKESELYWETFESPSCPAWYNYNFKICGPFRPENLAIHQTFLEDHTFSLNVSWRAPDYPPDYYTLHVIDLSENGNTYVMNVSGLEYSILISRIEIYGFMFEVHLTAYTPGGNSTVELTDLTKVQDVMISDKHYAIKLFPTILAPTLCFAILLLAIFLICQRRAKLKRYEERCKYFEDLEKKETINKPFDFTKKHITFLDTTSAKTDSLTDLDFDGKICFNDAMEIEKNNLRLLEILGEGAFGLVRRGIFHDEKFGSREVAVKMLKVQPTMDDIRAFRREIEVMKSVEQHPNIVGIIGHYTKTISEMMLLTEFCSLGNLLNFLRNEWKYLQELYVKGEALILPASYISFTTGKSIESRFKQRILREGGTGGRGRLGNGNSVKIRHKRLARRFNDNNSTNKRNNYQRPHQNVKNKKYLGNGNVGNSIANNNIPRKFTRTLNLDAVVVEKIQEKYHNLHKNDCNNSAGCHISTTMQKSTTTTIETTAAIINGNTAEKRTTVETQTTPTDSKITTKLTARDNKSYGYSEICTSACKCRVDMINTKDNLQMGQRLTTIPHTILSTATSLSLPYLTPFSSHHQCSKAIPESDSGNHSYVPTIKIRNCDCKLLLRRNNGRSSRKRIRVKRFVENKCYEKNSTMSFKAKTTENEVNTVLKKSRSVTFNNNNNNNNDYDYDNNNDYDYSEHTRTKLSASSETTYTTNSLNRIPLSAADLLDIAKQVAVGMEFLAKNKVVHRDLAARNVLVSSDRTIKIADFGLSRDVYQENIYKKIGNGKLPIKWMALESMTHQVYTTQSDVWSYGILLYEIVTLGGIPYPTTSTKDLLDLLKSGYRMEKPKNCEQEFYNLMHKCWSFHPAERPTFTEIIKTLENLINKTSSEKQIKDSAAEQKDTISQDVACDGEAYLKPL